jgi:hypothetical protein
VKSSFKNLFGDDKDLTKEMKVKVQWEPIKLQTEEQKQLAHWRINMIRGKNKKDK